MRDSPKLETVVFWATGAVSALGFLFALLAPMAFGIDPHVARTVILVACLAAIVSGGVLIDLKFSFSTGKKVPRPLLAVVGMIISVAVVYFYFTLPYPRDYAEELYDQQKEKDSFGGYLFLQCDFSDPPKPGSDAFLFETWEMGLRANLVTAIGGDWTKSFYAHDTWQRCKVVNYTNRTLLEVHVGLSFLYQDAVKQPTGGLRSSGRTVKEQSALFYIPKLDMGESNPFVFYVFNMGNDFVFMKAPATVSERTIDFSAAPDLPLRTQIGGFYLVPHMPPPKDATPLPQQPVSTGSKKQP